MGICASKGALSATSATSSKAENTAASGVRAPACRLGMERFIEPQDTYDEKKPPTMLDRPWPRNSRLVSMRCPDLAATALAMEIAWPSATMVSANASPSNSGTWAQLTCGSTSLGQGTAMLPTVRKPCIVSTGKTCGIR